MISLLLKAALLITAAILFVQWCLLVFRIDRSLGLFSLNIQGQDGHNMILGDLGGLLLAVSTMSVLFVFHSSLWMYPLMMMSACVMLGRIISFLQRGVSHIGIVGLSLEALGMTILLLFATNLVTY